MIDRTTIEHLPNEILFEIFKCLDAAHIFLAFSSLNERISSIIRSTELHVMISPKQSGKSLDALLKHLPDHIEQVAGMIIWHPMNLSASTVDRIFSGSRFENLRFCVLSVDGLIDRFPNFMAQIKRLTHVRELHIRQLTESTGWEKRMDAPYSMFHQLQSKNLSALTLLWDYSIDQPFESNRQILPWLNDLELLIHPTAEKSSVDLVMDILRCCPALKKFKLTVKEPGVLEQVMGRSTAAWNESFDQLPQCVHLTSFDLCEIDVADYSLIPSIFSAMPNLKHFTFTFFDTMRISSNSILFTDGHVWHAILATCAPRLITFDFSITLLRRNSHRTCLNTVINSFECFREHDHHWHMVASRWLSFKNPSHEFLQLQTRNFKYKSMFKDYSYPVILAGTLEMKSTLTTDECDHQLQSHHKCIEIVLSESVQDQSVLPIHIPLVRLTEKLFICFEHEVQEHGWESVLKFFGVEKRPSYDAKVYLRSLANTVDLKQVKCLFIRQKDALNHADCIELILLACKNLSSLIIDPCILFAQAVLKKPSLIPVFQRIKFLQLNMGTDKVIFVEDALKVVQYFPSLLELQLNVVSYFYCIEVMKILTIHLPCINCICIGFPRETLHDYPMNSDYIVEEGATETFIFPEKDSKAVLVENTGDSLLVSVE